MINDKQRKQYLKTQIQTASKEQLVLMLYNGVIRFCNQGKKFMEEKDWEQSHENLMRAQAIIMELLYNLDNEKGGEIAQNLTRLYTYTFQRTIVANMQHDTAPIDEVVRIISGIRDSWAEAMNNVEQTSQSTLSEADSITIDNGKQEEVQASEDRPDSVDMSGAQEQVIYSKPQMTSPKPSVPSKPKISQMAAASAYMKQPRLSMQG
ncbi:MAG: flagellar export chaperone FliS [Planctomycetes bacterium]|nr:flagellar export chaperone FliS [Planctomycetota bacterium]